MQKLVLYNETAAVLISDQLDPATTSRTRLRGLLGRSCLRAGEGIWIVPSSGVHTFGMRFSIDVVGLSEEMRVVRLWPGLKPQRLTALSLRVKSILELAEGQIHRAPIRLGDKLMIRRVAQEAR